ncbi:MAG: ligase-associated DNA damage response endonuclease PdeM [Planctomycetota bacterium]
MDTETGGIIEMHGISVHLHASGAVYWPAAASLLIADLHLGKEAVFQKAGIPIPCGSSESTLRSLRSLVNAFEPQRVIVLGDLLHAKVGLTPWLQQELSSLCREREAMEWILIPGNHDRGAIKALRGCGWHVSSERMEFHGVEMVHAPDDSRLSRASLTISGHLHPSIRIELGSKDRVCLRCFWFTASQLILPAFGGWTGTKPIVPSKTDRVFACVENDVIEISHQRT